MNKVCFVIPYFGSFKNYFQLFLNSCGENRDLCDWLILTDNRTGYDYPQNVKVVYTTFDDLKDVIQSKFDFELNLNKAYKLCDFKPAYGYIFEEYLKEYDFWGHCDTDLIWGNIAEFLSKIDMYEYDKIFDLGHCTLYRNTLGNNRFFMSTSRYKDVFQNSKNCSFDEEYRDSVNNIFENGGKKIYQGSFAANTYMKTSDFKLTTLNDDRQTYAVEKKVKNFFVWNKGNLIRYLIKDNGIEKNAYMYLHFQSRSMDLRVDSKSRVYKIIPNAFEKLEIPAESIDEKNVRKIKTKNFNLHYFKLRFSNLVIKLKEGVDRG